MPSLIDPRDMNSYGYDRGGLARVNGIAANGGYDHYRDDYVREDMRRDDDDRYRRGLRNGGPSFERFNTDYLDQNSLSDFRSNEPKFELDHLATFAAGSRNGVIHAEDGLRKLRQMENTTGIWTMRCLLIVERHCVVILDNSTGEELEKFPIQLVQDPTAIFKNDRREIYNNLILFTVIDDPKKRYSQADMHIFQSSKAPAQEIVDEILAAKSGQQKLYQGGGPRIPPPPVGRAPEPPGNAYDFQGMKEFFDSRQVQTNNTTTDVRQFNQFNQTSYSQGGQFGGPIGQQRSLITRINTVRERESIEGGSTEILERDVQLLNHCFDDIEKFVARLQQAAESYKELEKRKRDRGAKNKKRQSGDGMLNARARPPPDRDFVDIFQKFKLSFNLLAKLKAHIHDPNAPELVHFLFTPLSLIYEASRDPFHGNQNLGDQALAPVLTGDAKQLLLNCLTSKEIELWQALGKHWTTSRDEWQGHVPPYIPEFYDGWQPAAAVIDELAARTAVMSQPAIMPAPLPMIEPARAQPAIEDRQRGYNAPRRPMPFPDDDRPVMDRYHRQDDFERFESNPRGYEPNSHGLEPLPSRGFKPVHEPSTSRGYEPLASWGLEPPQRFEARSNERSPPRSGMGSPYSTEFNEMHHVERNARAEIPKADRNHLPPGGLSRQDENNAFYNELRRLGDVSIYEAAHDRVGKNSKELTVQKGDVVQVLDNSKNWWKLRNYKNEVGFAPYTILKVAKTEDDDHFEWSEQSESDHILNGAPTSWTANSETSHFGDERGSSWKEDRARDTHVDHGSLQRLDHRRRSDSPPRPQGNVSSSYQKEEPALRKNWSPHIDRRESYRQRSSSPAISGNPQEPQKRISVASKPRSVLPQPRNHSPSPPRRVSTADPRNKPRFMDSEEQPLKLSSPSFRSAARPPVIQNKRKSPPKYVPPPPPQPKSMYKNENFRYQNGSRQKQNDTAKTVKDVLHEELRAKVTGRQPRSFKVTNERANKQAEVNKINQNSSAHDVMEWLTSKGFSNFTIDTFKSYTGSELFQLHLTDLKDLIGHEEAIRLDGLITLQKSSSGYATRSAKELNDILRLRKKTIEREPEILPYQLRQEEELKAEAMIERTGNPRKGSESNLRDQLVSQKSRLRQSQHRDYD